jgi:hypothetical protein
VSERSNVRCANVSAIAFWGRGRKVVATNRRGSGASSPFSLHAEERLIRKLLKLKAIERWGMPSVAVYRYRKDGTLGNSFPCTGCQRQLRMMGFTVVNCVLDADRYPIPCSYYIGEPIRD